MQVHEFLGRAQALMIERGREYDKPVREPSMDKASHAFEVITGLRPNLKREQEGTV